MTPTSHARSTPSGVSRALLSCLLSAAALTSVAFGQSSSADLTEAERHYKVARIAIQNDDMGVATKELETAAQLAPNSAVIHYNLAIVESRNGRPGEALRHLKRAQELGLPAKDTENAEELLAQLTYAAQKATGGLSWLIGTWDVEEGTGSITKVMGVRWYNYDVECTYSGPLRATLTIQIDPDDPDAMVGRLYNHFRADTIETNNERVVPRDIDACKSNFGRPEQISGDKVLKLTKVSNGKEGHVRMYFVRDLTTRGPYFLSGVARHTSESEELMACFLHLDDTTMKGPFRDGESYDKKEECSVPENARLLRKK